MLKKLIDLPVGAKVKDENTKYYGKPIVWKIADKNHTGYPSNTVTLISDKILSIKAFDGREQKNSDRNRRLFGNNYYKHSNILQWLNSDKKEWYSPQHSADAPPNSNNVSYNPYDEEHGFQFNFSSDFKKALVPTGVKTGRHIIDDGESENVTTKIFLASTTEVGLDNENGIAEGTRFPIFDGKDSRKAYPTKEATQKSSYSLNSSDSHWWWLRTPSTSDSSYVRGVNSYGSLVWYGAYDGGSGVRPLCNLQSEIFVSNTTDSDGAYILKFVEPPKISGSDYDLGSKTESFDVEYYVTIHTPEQASVKILVDGLQRETKKVNNNQKNSYHINIKSLNLGRHTVKIVATDSNGNADTRTYTFYKSNSAPIISGEDKSLGGKSLGFTINYDITDTDGDEIDVTISLGDEELSKISTTSKNGLSFTLDDEKVKKLTIGDEYTITIKADDRKGGISYRRYRFTKTNSAPVISGTNKDLGEKKEAFKHSFSVTDYEKDEISFEVKLDGKVIKNQERAVDGQNYRIDIDQDEFIRLSYGKHTIRIEAWDNVNPDDKQVRELTFTRVSSGLEVEILVSTSTVQPKKILAVPHGIFAKDSTMTVFVCNNYKDSSPKWEDATSMSKIARAYAFKNKSKAGDRWAIGIKVVVENGSSGEKSILKGVKGGFE